MSSETMIPEMNQKLAEDLNNDMKNGEVIGRIFVDSYARGQKLLSKEVSDLGIVKGTKMSQKNDINKRLIGSIPEGSKLNLRITQDPLQTKESLENSLLGLEPPLTSLHSFQIVSESRGLNMVVAYIGILYAFDKKCIEDVTRCGKEDGDKDKWYERRYGSDKSYFNDRELQAIMPLIWEELEKNLEPVSPSVVMKLDDDGSRDFYRDNYDTNTTDEISPLLKVQKSPFLCPFYYSLYEEDTDNKVLEPIFLKKKTILLSILEVMESKMASSFQTLIAYVTANDVQQKEDILKSTRLTLIETCIYLGLCNHNEAQYICKKYSYTKKQSINFEKYIFDQVVPDGLDDYLSDLTPTTLADILSALKSTVSGDFSRASLEKISYMYRGFRELSKFFPGEPTTTTTKLSKESFELYFKKKGNEFLSLYEDISSSLRVYIRINTGPPPGITSPFYDGVRTITGSKPYTKKRSCQSIEDCSVAPAIKDSSGKSIIYRKSEGYDGVFHRMMASDKNPINTQDLFKECYSSKELLSEVSINIKIVSGIAVVQTDAKANFEKQLSQYLNLELSGISSLNYDVTDPTKQNPRVEDQIFVTIGKSLQTTDDRLLCQVTKILLDSSDNTWKSTIVPVKDEVSITDQTILFMGNMKSIIIETEDKFSNSNEGMTIASFGEFQEVYESVNRHLDKGYDANKEIYYGNCSYLLGFDGVNKVFNIKGEESKLFCDLFDRQQSFFLNKAILFDDSAQPGQPGQPGQPELNRLRLVPNGTDSDVTIRFRDMMTASRRVVCNVFPIRISDSNGQPLLLTAPLNFEGTNIILVYKNEKSTITIEVKIKKSSDLPPGSGSDLPHIIVHQYYEYTCSFNTSECKEFKMDFFSLGSLFYDGEILDDEMLRDEVDKNLFRQVQGQFELNDGKFAFAIDTYDYESQERKDTSYFDGLVALKSTNEGLCDLVNLVKENCSGFTIFGYGYSGTGKSYTLFGDASKNLFERVRSCFELYVKNMKALGITSPQFMSLQMVINKIKATIVSTNGIPIYNVARGGLTEIYGFQKNSYPSSTWKKMEYLEEDIPFHYGLPHPVVIENIRLLQKKPESRNLKTLDQLDNGTICLVHEISILVPGQQFLIIEKVDVNVDDNTKITKCYAIPYYGNFNLDDILLCEDRNANGELFSCTECKWNSSQIITQGTKPETIAFEGSLVLKGLDENNAKVIPIDDGIRFFIDDCITEDDVIDIWTEADNKKVMLIVSYLQWYMLEDLYNTIELIGSRESYFLKKSVYDKLPSEKKNDEYFKDQLLNPDEKALVPSGENLPVIKRQNKVTCLFTQQEQSKNELFHKHRKSKEARVHDPFKTNIQQQKVYMENKKKSMITRAKEQLQRFRDLNAYVPNKGLKLDTGYGVPAIQIAEDGLADDITYYDLTNTEWHVINGTREVKSSTMNHANFNMLNYLVYKYDIPTLLSISNGHAPAKSEAETKLGFSRGYLITKAVKEADFKVFSELGPNIKVPSSEKVWKISGDTSLELKEDLFPNDKPLFNLLKYMFTLDNTDAKVQDFLLSDFTITFSSTSSVNFTRLNDIKNTLNELMKLCEDFKILMKDFAFVESLDVADKIVEVDAEFVKKYVFDPSFYVSSGIFKPSIVEKKTDFLDIVSKIKAGKSVEGNYTIEEENYVEQSLSYFHLFHIPTTKMETSTSSKTVGKQAVKGPVYGFVQLTMKNLIQNGFTVKMYAAFDLYGTSVNPDNDAVLDTSQYLSNGTIKRYNFLREPTTRYADDLLFGNMALEPETNLINEMSATLIDVCERGFHDEEDITSFYELLQKIEKKRIEVGCIKPTPNNPQSSRGHLFLIFEVSKNILPIDIDDKWYSAPGSPAKKTYITVIDMAGVENPLTIAQKVNTFKKGVSLEIQKESMFKWFTPNDSNSGFSQLEESMNRVTDNVNIDTSQSVIPYVKVDIPRPLEKEKKEMYDSLVSSTTKKTDSLETDIKKLMDSIKATLKSTFYTSEYTFFAGFKICDTIQTCWDLVLVILEYAYQSVSDPTGDVENFEFDVTFQLNKVNDNSVEIMSYTDLEIGVNNVAIMLKLSYTVSALPRNISEFLTNAATVDKYKNVLSLDDTTFSHQFKIPNHTASHPFSTLFFNEKFPKLKQKFIREKAKNYVREDIVAYQQKYSDASSVMKQIEEEKDRVLKETEYESFLATKRNNSVEIHSRENDMKFLKSYTFHSFFENYQKQENESGLFVDANFLFFRLKGFPLKRWLKTYLDKNASIKLRFDELLNDTSSGIGVTCPDSTDCDPFASFLLVETLMDENIFNLMLTLNLDFVKTGTAENGIHNTEFLKRRAKDDFERLDSALDEIKETMRSSSDDKKVLQQQKQLLELKKEVYQYLYYYTPWWGGSVLFKTSECGMGFSIDLERLGIRSTKKYVERIHDLQKHCLIALIEQIINEGYFINETISHIVTYFKHTSRGVSDADPLRLRELKGNVQPTPLTSKTAVEKNGKKTKSVNYFVEGSTQINPKYLLSDLEAEYVPIINPLKVEHFKVVFKILSDSVGRDDTIANNEEAKQFLFTVYKSTFDLYETKRSKSQETLSPQSGGEMKSTTVELLNGVSLKLLLNENPTLESVDKKLRQELSLDKIPFTTSLVEIRENNFYLSSQLPPALKNQLTEVKQLKDIVDELTKSCPMSSDAAAANDSQYASLYKGPKANQSLFCSTMSSFFQFLSNSNNDEIFSIYSKIEQIKIIIEQLVQIFENVRGQNELLSDETFELFSNYYKKPLTDNVIDDFDTALQTQLSNETNTVKMIPLLQYLKNLTGGKCKYVMLCLIRPEIKAQYCEGARKGLQFAEAVASTSSKVPVSVTNVDHVPEGGRRSKKNKRRISNSLKQSLKQSHKRPKYKI